MMHAKLDRKLRPFFDAKTSNPVLGREYDAQNDRYVPLAYSADHTGWGVFDRRQNRFLEECEVLKVKQEDLMNEKVLNA